MAEYFARIAVYERVTALMKTMLAGCLLLFFARDSRAVIMACSSLEWIVDHSRAIGIYKVVDPGERPGQGNAPNDLKLALDGKLKGDAPKTAQTQAPDGVAAGDRFLVLFERDTDGSELVEFINLKHVPPGGMIDARIEALTDGAAILRAVRARIAHGPPRKHQKYPDPNGAVLADNYLVIPVNVLPRMNPKGAVCLQIPDDLMEQAMTRCDLLEIVKGLEYYFDTKHVMPAGGNAAIITALIKEQAVDGEDFNGKRISSGKLCDLWGTPYRIGASNPKFPWAYSCGSDKKDEGGAPGTDDITSW